MEGPTLAVIREVQRREARAKPVGAVIEARDPAAEVEVVQIRSNQGLNALTAPLAQPVDHEEQQ